MTHGAAGGVLLLDHKKGTLRHPLHRIRPAVATATVGVQLDLRNAANAEPLLLHGLSRGAGLLGSWHLFLKRSNDWAKPVVGTAFLDDSCSVSDGQPRRKR
jgi:hypothetical protein